MDRATLREAWVVIVEECGANFRDGASFIRYALDHPDWTEWRFGASLGFGGKLKQYMGRLFVDCYPEDETPERREMIDKANARLAGL